MPEITESTKIKDVQLVTLKAFADDRGRFIETFRTEWFPQRSWDKIQTNRSDSKAGVLRGLHFHHHQVDYWYVPRGTIRVGLCDLRPDSPTFMATQTLEIGDDNQMGVFIPVGVAHGFYALTDATLTYLVDNYYDGSDEHGVAWDDPELGVPWGAENPILSPRDAQNRRWKDIPADEKPR